MARINNGNLFLMIMLMRMMIMMMITTNLTSRKVLMIYEINHIWTAEMKWESRNDRRSERNLCNYVKKPEKNSGLQRGLNPWPRHGNLNPVNLTWSPFQLSLSWRPVHHLLAVAPPFPELPWWRNKLETSPPPPQEVPWRSSEFRTWCK